ncbi:GHKL domain-containing protein [Clostridium sp. FP2]|uniref:sensor histidine kinase n=1 Tax=Clostridium sp. FP2 TaxID=2724481 RepID=UPI001CCC66F9|nr:GHKL domain-containing protein [Clostridium sp. FP2]MBZ9626029.1 GHKL domain-containing protein [Clostridium sp. FP2]
MPRLILNITYMLILTVNISIIMTTISIIKISIKNILIFNTIIFIISFLLYVNKQNYLLSPSITIVILIYLYIISKKLYYTIIFSAFTQLIFVLSDAITGFFLVFVIKLNYSEILNNPKAKVITSLSILLISYVISKVVEISFKKKYFSNFIQIKSKNILIFAGCLLIALISIYLYSNFLKDSFKSFGKINVALNLFFILFFSAIIIILTKLNNENTNASLEVKFRDEELSKLKEYTSMLEYVSNDLRNFKHDYINILQIMDEYIKSDNIEGLKIFYENNLVPESKKILEKDICFMLLQHIKIDPLKAIISSKIINAQSKNIKVKIEIIDDINELSINLIDICRIVGILLDNAIEATELCDNKFINFLIFKDEKSTSLIINNSCNESTPSIHKIYEKNFSTKGFNRGIGLKFVKTIIKEKYTNVLLNTKIQNLTFCQEFIIINNSNKYN